MFVNRKLKGMKKKLGFGRGFNVEDIALLIQIPEYQIKEYLK